MGCNYLSLSLMPAFGTHVLNYEHGTWFVVFRSGFVQGGRFYPNLPCLLHWNWRMVAPISVKQPWRIWIICHLDPLSLIMYSKQIKAPQIRLNTLRPRQNGRHFADYVFKCILINDNVWISLKISLKFVPKGPINNIPAMVQIMAWRRPGDNPLSEPMMVSLPTHICVARPQWGNIVWNILYLCGSWVRCWSCTLFWITVSHHNANLLYHVFLSSSSKRIKCVAVCHSGIYCGHYSTRTMLSSGIIDYVRLLVFTDTVIYRLGLTLQVPAIAFWRLSKNQ